MEVLKRGYPDSRYCEMHMHRGKSRSRKPVNISLSSSSSTLTNNSTKSNFITLILTLLLGSWAWWRREKAKQHCFVLGADFKQHPLVKERDFSFVNSKVQMGPWMGLKEEDQAPPLLLDLRPDFPFLSPRASSTSLITALILFNCCSLCFISLINGYRKWSLNHWSLNHWSELSLLVSY